MPPGGIAALAVVEAAFASVATVPCQGSLARARTFTVLTMLGWMFAYVFQGRAGRQGAASANKKARLALASGPF